MFQAIRKNIEKSHWTVTRQWSEVTRPLDDCQTTFFWRFKQFGKILKKVTEGHAAVVLGHATVGWLSNNVFFDVSSNSENFWKKSLKVTRQWSEVTRPLYDCQPSFFDVSSNSKNFWKKSLKVTRQWSEVTRPFDDCKQRFLTFQAIQKIYEKSHWRSRDSGRRSRDRRMTVKQRF